MQPTHHHDDPGAPWASPAHRDRLEEGAGLVIDCGCCAMRNTSACDDCVVSFLLSEDQQPVELTSAESSALDALAEEGLVPRLRLIHRDRRLDDGGAIAG